MIYVFLAQGFEETEAITPIDMLRRCGKEVITVGVTGKTVKGSHGVEVICDKVTSELDEKYDFDMIILPGGMPGTLNLEAHEGLSKLIDKYNEEGKYLAAICAAPSILGHHNILNGKKATCYPGYEKDLYGAEASKEAVVVDGKVITARGMGKAVGLGLKLLEVFAGKDTADKMAQVIQF